MPKSIDLASMLDHQRTTASATPARPASGAIASPAMLPACIKSLQTTTVMTSSHLLSNNTRSTLVQGLAGPVINLADHKCLPKHVDNSDDVLL